MLFHYKNDYKFGTDSKNKQLFYPPSQQKEVFIQPYKLAYVVSYNIWVFNMSKDQEYNNIS